MRFSVTGPKLCNRQSGVCGVGGGGGSHGFGCKTSLCWRWSDDTVEDLVLFFFLQCRNLFPLIYERIFFFTLLVLIVLKTL